MKKTKKPTVPKQKVPPKLILAPPPEPQEEKLSPHGPNLVLSMIAGNEEKVIARCLKSVGEHVDSVVISVNGQDGTEEIARSFGAHVVREPWRDFGWNRTRAAQASRRFAIHKGYDLASTYLLLLDADMILRVDDQNFREKLVFPHYRLDQRNAGGQRWENSRLLRLDHDWRCVKRTHEFWAAFPDVFPQRLDGVWLDDLNDGGEHSRKYERDAVLLTRELDDDPGDARSLFYLGETYYHWAQQAEEAGQKETAIHRFERAVEFYERRWKAGDWDEERWFARYKQGHAELKLSELHGGSKWFGDDYSARGIALLLEAYEARPGRAEVTAALARGYRLAGKNALSVLFGKAAKATPVSRDTLFVDETAWKSKIDEDLAFACWYTGDVAEGRAACDRLSSARELGSGYQDKVSYVEGWYTPHAVEASRRGTFHVPAEVLEGGRWAPSTPTIVRAPSGQEGFLVGVRLVNYWQERGRWYEARDPDRIIRTKTAVLMVSEDLERQEFLGVLDGGYPEGWRLHDQIHGLEDQRWCLHGNRIWFTATTYDGDPPRGPRVVLGRLSDDFLRVQYVTDLHYGGATNCEKNWVPRSLGGKLEIVYSYDPFVVLDVDVGTGQCTMKSKTEPPLVGSRWRGGAIDGGYGVVHEVVRHWNQAGTEVTHHVYFHRFIEMTNEKVIRASRLFSFDHHGIEYAAGLINGPDEVIVTYSTEDKEAKFAVFTAEECERCFRDGAR